MVGGRKLRYQYYELFDAGNVDAENNLLDPESPRAHANRVSIPPPPFPRYTLASSRPAETPGPPRDKPH